MEESKSREKKAGQRELDEGKEREGGPVGKTYLRERAISQWKVGRKGARKRLE